MRISGTQRGSIECSLHSANGLLGRNTYYVFSSLGTQALCAAQATDATVDIFDAAVSVPFFVSNMLFSWAKSALG